MRFFVIAPPTTVISTLSLHDALPISDPLTRRRRPRLRASDPAAPLRGGSGSEARRRSEEHTSELQSHSDLVCRLLIEKKNSTKVLPSPTARYPVRLTSTPTSRNWQNV